MDLPNIDPERMKAASEALEKVIKEGGTHEAARAEFMRVIRGEPVEPAETIVVKTGEEEGGNNPAKTRKTRADKGQPRKRAPPKPAELAAAGAKEAPAMTEPPRAARIGQLVLELVKELMG